MPKDKETKLVSMKRCAALKLRLGRKTPADRASVELLTPVTSVDDGTQPSASSTIALPSSSPPVSLSSSFFSIRTETLQTQPLLTSTPNTSFTPAYYTPSALSSPVPSPIYSLPAPLQQVAFLPGPPTPAPTRLPTPSPAGVSVAKSPFICDTRSLQAQLRPIRPAPRTSPLFAAPPQLVIPEPRRVVRVPGVPMTRAALRNYNSLSNGAGGLDLRVNRPYPESRVFTDKLRNIISKVSPLLVFYESQGENLFTNPSIRDLYKKKFNRSAQHCRKR